MTQQTNISKNYFLKYSSKNSRSKQTVKQTFPKPVSNFLQSFETLQVCCH